MGSLASALPWGRLLFDVGKYIDGKLSDSDQDAFTTFLRKLTDFGVLTAPYEAEYAGPVIQSIENLRKLIVDSTVSLKPNSKLEKAFFALGVSVRDFQTKIGAIDNEIRRKLDLAEVNERSGVVLNSSTKEFLEHWKWLGYPAKILRENHRLNTGDIRPPLYQQQFLLNLGEFRSNFGAVISTICEATCTPLPAPLSSLTPGIEEFEQGTEIESPR